MSLAVIHTRAVCGIEAVPVSVEVHLGGGLPALSVVGLPETAVKESKDRVRAALLNAGFEFPARRITVNLAPADLPKHGGRFDLPIAIGILAASGQLPSDALQRYEFVGELALSGDVRTVGGVLPTAIAAAKAGHGLVVPEGNAAEASLAQGDQVYPVSHIMQVCHHFNDVEKLAMLPPSSGATSSLAPSPALDMADVKGQYVAKRALEIAAAGNHNLLMTGPPGTGKSMLASRLAGILPPMRLGEALESAAIRSVSGQSVDARSFLQRPFRAPHHTASGVALVGGGSTPRPGEISLAHNGVLFLDELPEFSRHVLDVLREPLENGHITISRATRQADFPARFLLLAARNRCPCGHYGDDGRECRCSPGMISRYQARVSGPLLDRIDLHVSVPRLALSEMQAWKEQGESSAVIQQRVVAARQRQLDRAGKANAHLNGKDLEQHCQLTPSDLQYFEAVIERLQLSMRAYARTLKTARTIADLDEADQIDRKHMLEALSYRESDGE